MKLQHLAIIFIIIILPISIVLSEYINHQIDTEKKRMEYDKRLLNSTYDSIKAYQLNTVNNAFGDITNKKIKDLEAAAKTFYNSLASNFHYTGYKAEVMREYIPAIVYTLYDGYYIYSPFINTLTEIKDDDYDKDFSKNGRKQDGLKPYVYYTARYTRGSDDFVITYTLDNYITIQGKISGATESGYVYDYGYLYNIASSIGDSKNNDGIYFDGANYYYDGIAFSENDTEQLREFVGDREYPYAKINGKKYYLEHSNGWNESNTDIDTYAKIFFIGEDGNKNYSQTKGYYSDEKDKFEKYYNAITKNKSAYEYYKNAYQFSCAVLGNPVPDYRDKTGVEAGKSELGSEVKKGYGLSNLKSSDAVIYKDNQNPDITKISSYGDFDIFGGDKIEYSNSNFNKHRKSVIRYIVETNLTAAISAYSSNSVSDFIMPKISEKDWEIIQNEVCSISFLQGLNLGSKRYNGYAVVANTLTKDFVSENDIYILTQGNIYSRVNDSEMAAIQTKDQKGYYPGVWKLNFEVLKDLSSGKETFYSPISYIDSSGNVEGYKGNYTSIMGSSGLTRDYSIENSDMYTFVKNKANNNLKKVYYTALARERWGGFNINNINYEVYNTTGNEYFLADY